jgi:hypothetical protein
MAALATTPLPQPHEAAGVVSNDLGSRCSTVKLSDTANGYTRLLWREAFQALQRSEEGGWRNGHPTVYASTPGAYHVAHAVAGDAAFGGMLNFAFQPGEAEYTKLIGSPGLTATLWIDRASHRFINCNFKHGRKGS